MLIWNVEDVAHVSVAELFTVSLDQAPHHGGLEGRRERLSVHLACIFEAILRLRKFPDRFHDLLDAPFVRVLFLGFALLHGLLPVLRSLLSYRSNRRIPAR